MKSKTLYDICLSKKTSVTEMFQWLGFDKDWYSLDLGERHIRFLDHVDKVQFSEPKNTFDRWANSTDVTLDLTRKSERKILLEMLIVDMPELKDKLAS